MPCWNQWLEAEKQRPELVCSVMSFILLHHSEEEALTRMAALHLGSPASRIRTYKTSHSV